MCAVHKVSPPPPPSNATFKRIYAIVCCLWFSHHSFSSISLPLEHTHTYTNNIMVWRRLKQFRKAKRKCSHMVYLYTRIESRSPYMLIIILHNFLFYVLFIYKNCIFLQTRYQMHILFTIYKL